MSTTVDSRVVEMQFDNKQFESNVQTSMNTLSKLKDSLNLSDAAKGLESLSKAGNDISFDGLTGSIDTVQSKFSGLDVVAATIFHNITNYAIEAGKSMLSSLTEGITAGFSEYETQINAIQTILANTESKGTTLDNVNAALDELNTYADKTIYNFTEMTRNIGTFTAAGVDLDTSVAAIKGIANLAAVSGSTSTQASTAMYQLSQALASGTVKLMDWNSVVNAGMGGQVFQDALKETARVHGIAIDEMIESEGSFRETLSSGWLSADILTETLAKFTGDLTEDQLKTMGYTEEQIEGIIKMGQTANDAATKVKTFTQLFDTLKEATQSGWTQTWEIIVGDFEEAKELLTEVSDIFGEMINESASARNEMLQGWKDLGGRTALIEAVRNAFEGVMNIITPIKEAFREIFPPTTSEQLYNITVGLKNLTERFKNSTADTSALKSTFKGLFAILDIGKQIISAVWGIFKPIPKETASFGGELLKVTGAIGDWLVKLSETTKETGVFKTALKALVTPFQKLGNLIKEVATSDQMKSFLESVNESMKKFGTGLIDNFKAGVELVKEFGTAMKEKLGEAKESFGVAGEAIKDFGEKFLNVFGEVIGILADFIIEFLDVRNAICSFWEGGGGVAGIFEIMFDKLADIVRLVFDLAQAITGIDLSSMKESVVTAIQQTRNKVVDAISNMEDSVAEFGGKVKEAFKEGIDIIKEFGGSVATDIGAAIGTFAGFIESVKEKFDFPGLEIFHDFLIKIKEKMDDIKTSVGEMKTGVVTAIDSMGDSIVNSKLVQFFKDLWEGLKTIASGIGNAAGSIGDTLGETFTGDNFGEFIGGLSIGAIAVGIVQLVKSIKGIFEELGGVTEGLVGILDSVKGCFEAYQNSLNADALMKIASAIAILAASIVVLAMIDAGKLNTALVAISTLFAELMASMALFGKNSGGLVKASAACVALATAVAIMGGTLAVLSSLDPDGVNTGIIAIGALSAIVVASAKIMSNGSGQIAKGTSSLILFAAAIKILAGVCEDLSVLDFDGLIRGLGGVGVLLAEVALFLKVAKFSDDTTKTATGILVLSVALKVLADVCEDFADMEWEEIGKGLAGVGGLLLEVAAFTKLVGSPDKLISTATAMVILGGAMKVFASVIEDMGSMEWEEIGKGLLTMGVALAEIVIAVNLMPKDMISKGAGLAIIAAAMSTLGTALRKMGSMSWEEIAKGMVAMGGALAILVVGLNAMKGTLSGSAALLVASAAMLVMAPALKMLGNLSWKEIGTGLLVLAGAFLVLGGAAALLTPVIPGMVSLAGAFALIGVGVLGVGAGLLAAGAGLAALAAGFGALAGLGSAGAVAVVEALKTIIVGVADTIVVIGLKLGEAVIAFGQKIIEGAPVLCEAVVTVVKSIVSALVEAVPAIVEGVVLILTSALETLAHYAPSILESVLGILTDIVVSIANAMPDILKGVFDILMSVLDTIVEYTPDIVEAVLDIVIGFLDAIAEKLPDVIDSAVDVVLAFIEGITEKLPDIIQAGFDLLISFLNGITNAIDENTPMLVETMKDLFLALLNAALELLMGGIDLIKEAGQMIMDSGLIQGIKDKLTAFKDKVTEVVTAGVTMIKNKFTEWLQAGKDLIVKVITGIGDKFTSFKNKVKDLISDGLQTIKDKFTEWKDAGKDLIQKVINGILEKFTAIKDKTKELIDNAKEGITGKFSEWSQAGKDLISGFIGGIGEKASAAVEAAKGVVSDALQAAKNLLGINSPSKEFAEIGRYSDEGLIVGLNTYSGKVSNAAKKVGGNMLDAMADTISGISDIINDDDYQPTIRPVIDLSNVEAGARSLDTMFSRTQAMQLRAQMDASASRNNDSSDATSKSGNSYQFVQNNYSPKALSRIDIYRQTKNQFSAMERMVTT